MILAAKDSKGMWCNTGSDQTSETQDTRPLETATEFCRRVLAISERIWRLVTPILCDDSPEGTDFLGAEDDDVVEVGVKDTLSYAWRALKESSLLTQAFFEMFESSDRIQATDLRPFSNLIFAQLAQLRHRVPFQPVRCSDIITFHDQADNLAQWLRHLPCLSYLVHDVEKKVEIPSLHLYTHRLSTAF